MITKRSIISFDGICPMNCRHCYTYDLEDNKEIKTIETILKEIENEESDIIYISRRYENFFIESAGLKLTRSAFEKYHKHIFIITRCNLTDECINDLAQLMNEMKEYGKKLVIAISIPAMMSYSITEDSNAISSPEERCEVIKRIYNQGIPVIAMLRPVYPDSIIPVEELKRIIDNVSGNVDAVVSSGLAVNEEIKKRLNMENVIFKYLEDNSQNYLVGSEAKNIKYIDVNEELGVLSDYCKNKGIPFFTHSMEALNYIIP